MRRDNHFGWSLVAGFLVVGCAVGSWAKDKAKEPSKEQAAMMAQMQKYGTPGPEHQVLQGLVGRYTATVRSWMKPGDKVEEMVGTSDQSMILGGRYLKQDFHGTMAGQSFEGMGLTGYDKVREEYQSLWLDNMATGMMMGSGKADSSNVIQQSGTFGCPLTGEKNHWYRSEMKITDPNNYVYSSYAKDKDGKVFKNMEILYQRAK